MAPAAGFDWVTFLSDYGHDDVFVGVCKGAIARVAPHVNILDVCHLIAPQDVEQGAAQLAAAMPFLPVGVHLAVVDPQGDQVRGVAVRTGDGSLLVGPDNGLLSLAWDIRGGIAEAVEVANSRLWLERVHPTFRGRDVYAPVAGHLAAGRPLSDVGPTVAAQELQQISAHPPMVDDDHVHAEITAVDHFGNASLNIQRSELQAAGIELGDTVEVRCNGRTVSMPFTHTFSDVPPGQLALCEDAFRAVQFAVNAGRASNELRVSRGDPVVVARVPQHAPRARPAVTTARQ